jgi:hypothetical protein
LYTCFIEGSRNVPFLSKVISHDYKNLIPQFAFIQFIPTFAINQIQPDATMKKIFLFATAVLLAFSSFSQKANSKETFKNAVYIRFGYAMPGGTLKKDNIINTGGQFEVGTIFFINALKLPEKLKLGIDATYLSLSGFINKNSAADSNQTVSYFTAGVKLGPCLSYNFANNWYADLYFKVHPNFFITGQVDDKYEAAPQAKFGTAFGLNIRWKVLMLGCEFTSTKYDFKVANTPAARVLTTKVKETIKLPVTNLSLAVTF